MAYPVTQGTLIQRVRQHTNLEGATAFVTDAEIGDHLNISLAAWYDEVRTSTWGGQYYRSSFPFQTIASQQQVNFPINNPPPGSQYLLPLDFLHMISVDVLVSPNMPISAKAFQEEHRNLFRWWTVGWLTNTPIFYQIWGNTIAFIPAPQSTFEVQINYCPTAPRLYGPQDSFDSINGWEHFIVLDTAAKVSMKAGRSDMIPVFTEERERERARIKSMAPKRDMSQAERVHEIASYDSDWIW